MTNLAIRILLVLVTATILLYLSRFWPFELWARNSVLEQWGLRRGGGLLRFWLRGTPFATLELVIWASGSFLVLSFVESLCQRIAR